MSVNALCLLLALVLSPVCDDLDGFGTPWALPWADEYDDELDVTHGVDERNRLAGIVRADESTNINDDHEPVYDGAGNLVFDGDYWYQYDAWNRLVQVNEAWRDTQEPFDVVVGDLVKHHSYDGLGRLVRTQSPVLGPTALRTERFHYDGVRRIQEIVTDPVASPGGAMSSGDPELEALALSTVEPGTDEQAAPLAFEQGQVELMSGGGGGGPGGGGPGGGGIQPPRIDREYIWGPGDNGLDELLVQYDRYGDEWWAITDAGGDLVALCDLLGEGQYADVARVVAQWTYDAYGAVLTAEHLDGYTLDAAPHLGHKGLFLDRLDANVTQPRLVPFAHALYHARNRVYDVRHARWNQSDPNATALVLLAVMAHHGQELDAVVAAFSPEILYSDGGNLYEYIRSDPVNGSDPLGLWMWGDWGDTLGTGAAVLALASMVAETATFISEEAVEWALDWDRDDDEIADLAAIAWSISGDVDSEVMAIAGPYGPAIASGKLAIGKVAVKGLASSNKVQRAFQKWLSSGPQNVTVYIARTKDGKPKAVYTGITNNIRRRAGEHDLDLRPFQAGLTRNEARAIEQQILQANPHFRNINNSISPRHRFSEWAAEWAKQAIGRRNIRF